MRKPEDITPGEISQPARAGKCEMPGITKLVDTEGLSASYQIWGGPLLQEEVFLKPDRWWLNGTGNALDGPLEWYVLNNA